MKRDAHIHTPFCPNGTTIPCEDYIKKAIKLGYEDITFTEHAPLPSNFVDFCPKDGRTMSPGRLLVYMDEMQRLKEKYKELIHIRIGFEVDYLEDYERETTSFLNLIGPHIDDAMLTVRFLKCGQSYTCVDHSFDQLTSLARKKDTLQSVYNLYYKTITKSIQSNLGNYKPKRISNPLLFPTDELQENLLFKQQLIDILKLIAKHNYELDVNYATLSKLYCNESHPTVSYISYAKSLGIPIIHGSDAHHPDDLHPYEEGLFPFDR